MKEKYILIIRVLFFLGALCISTLIFLNNNFVIKILLLLSNNNAFNSMIISNFNFIKTVLIFFSILLLFFGLFLNLILKKIFNFIKKISTINIKLFIILIFSFSLILRILWIIFIQTEPFSDYEWYNNAALKISNGLGYLNNENYPTAFWPVGYPAFLALIYKLFGYNIFYAKIVNCLLSSITVVIIYFISNKIFNNIIARLSSIIYAIYPDNISYSSLLCSEILFTFLLLFSIFILLNNKNQTNYIIAFLSGIIIGVATLVREITLIYPFIFLIYLFHKYFNNEANFKRLIFLFLIFLFSMLIIILPWSFRNYKIFGTFQLTSTNGGLNLWMSIGPYATGTHFNPYTFGSEKDNPFLIKNINEVQRNKTANNMAINYIIKHPVHLLKLIPKKMFYLFKSGKSGISDSFIKIRNDKKEKLNLFYIFYSFFSQFFYIIVLFNFIFSFIIIKNNLFSFNDKQFLFIITLFYNIGIFIIFKSQPRYLFPIMPFLICLSSFSFFKILTKLNSA